MAGENLRNARKKKDLSQQKISDWLGIPKINLEQWETGKRKISPWLEKILVEKINEYRTGEKENSK